MTFDFVSPQKPVAKTVMSVTYKLVQGGAALQVAHSIFEFFVVRVHMFCRLFWPADTAAARLCQLAKRELWKGDKNNFRDRSTVSSTTGRRSPLVVEKVFLIVLVFVSPVTEAQQPS